ncbi:MAG: pyridoxal phosphate-dependent aminotransferase [Lawsonibacter sp.]|nr:pyridoxal phosphate-dependent aminotransferase [Lawsonibacter sp.]
MLSKRYTDMLSEKDIIFEIAGYGRQRSQEIGAGNVFDFSLGNPSVDAPASVNQAICSILTQRPALEVHGYGPGLGIMAVRQAVAQSLNRRFSMNYGPEHIFMTSGAASALAHAFRAVTQPGDELIIFAPYFSEYKPYSAGAGLTTRIVPADVSAFQIDFEALESLLNPKVTAVLVNSPNNPSGAVLSTPTLKRLAALLEERQKAYGHPIYLISDEPYREILFQGTDCPYTASLYANTLTCYSFSKSLSLPGERIGYLAVNPAAEEATRIVEVCSQISRTIGHNGATTLMQLTVGACIDQTSDLAVYQRNKDRLYQALLEYGYSCVEPGGTFYLFPRSLEPDAYAFCKKAQQLDLLFVPGDVFGCPGHFRIAYCVPEEKVIRALPRLKELAELYR